ncbi:hypothetical protein [Hamadaea tsunoensis]|uniref:hypothetical protein n=1 Tax=Hamadaea tsunoensis TaxID=53368 RepID=UPI00040B3A2D|nr:hypothetical protein [Hamadaea tsunoensis]
MTDEDLDASLSGRLAGLTFVDLDADAVTALLTDEVAAWGEAAGWRVYRHARSVVTLPPPMEQRHSWLDVACARADGSPVVIEIDHTDRRRTLDKLAAEADAGRVAIWVRFGSGPFPVRPDPPVLMVAYAIDSRRENGRRLYSARPPQRPAPAHSDLDAGAAEQADLFGPG